jgi:hypothetical protein
MRPAPPLVFPSSRVLAGWWRQLAPFSPRSLAVGHLLLHHVEALVLTRGGPRSDEPFAPLILRALTLSPQAASPAELEGRLHVGRQFLGRILAGLEASGFVEADAAGRCHVTPAGRSLAGGGGPQPPRPERRAFHFRDTPAAAFVPLEPWFCYPVAPPANWSFDPAALPRCVAQSPDWKRRRGFPQEVTAVLTPEESGDEPPAWQRVMVDRAEHLVLALAVVPGDTDEGELRGFAVESRGWLLVGGRPVLAMGPGWPEAFPEVAPGPPPEAWRGAWRTWCQGRGVPPAAAEACALSRDGCALRVEVPGEVRERLHLGNGEASREEVWLLAGEGGLRTAARVEFAGS